MYEKLSPELEEWLRFIAKIRLDIDPASPHNRELVCKICNGHMIWLFESDGKLYLAGRSMTSTTEFITNWIKPHTEAHPFEFEVLRKAYEMEI